MFILKNNYYLGFSLFEVLISLFIVSIVLSGFADMQYYAYSQILKCHEYILKIYSV